ncbi:MAG: POTRA domain-containing protein, partial [Planctomycetota bacterium]
MRVFARIIAVVMLFAVAWLSGCATTSGDADAPDRADSKQKVEIRIRGNPSIADRDLKRAAVDGITLLNREPKEYRADDVAFTMEECYREQGYPFARVSYEYDEGPPVRVVFPVSEGPRTVLGEVALEGRGDVSRHLLMRFFEGPSTSWIELGGDRLFVQSRVDQAAKLIRSWYRSEGYLKVEVDPPTVTFRDENTRADIRIMIRPGLKYLVRDLRFDGVDEKTAGVLVKKIDKEEIQPFSRAWQRNAENACSSSLRELGHVDPKVECVETVDNDSGQVDLRFDINAGPVCTVGKITFQGLERTEPEVLEPHLKLVSGKRFNGQALRETLVNLYEVGIFSKVRVRETPV